MYLPSMKSEYFVLLPNDICCSLQSFSAIALKRKSCDENFVTAKCAHINDRATLNPQIKFCTDLFPFQCVSSCPVTFLFASSYYYY